LGGFPLHDPGKLARLRQLITENLRVQKDTDLIHYVDVGSSLSDALSRQNHAIFARRGCGKTLLLHHSANLLGSDTKAVYLNCEDFKRHSFPNVLIEILVALIKELEKNATGWFGQKRRIKDILSETQKMLLELQPKPDSQYSDVNDTDESKHEVAAKGKATTKVGENSLSAMFGILSSKGRKLHRAYQERFEKAEKLDLLLPRLKEKLREFFENSSKVKYLFIQIDDLYQLKRADQPFVMDYIHRICKDLPIYFKVATLRHASTLFIQSSGQPIGAQERHDYQPIDLDFNFSNFQNTETQNWKILIEFGKRAGMSASEINSLFKGEGFSRLVMAGGGVPRDVLSLFLQAHSNALEDADPRIGKDSVRILSKETFERRIEELKQDSKADEQDVLLRGIYVIKKFFLDRKTNIFLMREREIQQVDDFRELVYRLLDYRIIHSCADALTHKSREGTFKAFAVDIGCYAHLRKLQDRFVEIDISESRAKEKMRSAPILSVSDFTDYAGKAPEKLEESLMEEVLDE